MPRKNDKWQVKSNTILNKRKTTVFIELFSLLFFNDIESSYKAIRDRHETYCVFRFVPPLYLYTYVVYDLFYRINTLNNPTRNKWH